MSVDNKGLKKALQKQSQKCMPSSMKCCLEVTETQNFNAVRGTLDLLFQEYLGVAKCFSPNVPVISGPLYNFTSCPLAVRGSHMT